MSAQGDESGPLARLRAWGSRNADDMYGAAPGAEPKVERTPEEHEERMKAFTTVGQTLMLVALMIGGLTLAAYLIIVLF